MNPRPVFATALLGLLAVPAHSFADGCFVWRNEQVDIHEPEQKAAIFWGGGHEDLVLTVKFEGAPDEFGWIVPVPAVPEMSPEDPALFERLSMATQNRPKLRSSRLARAGMTMGSDAVDVVKQETVGMYDVTVLRASDGSALESWLGKHDFRLPPESSNVLDRYARRDWVFVAMRIAAAADSATAVEGLRTGTIHPIRFRFACDRPVYPLEISSVLAKESDVLLYVVSEEPWVPLPLAATTWETMVLTRDRGSPFLDMYFYENPHRDHALLDGLYFITKSRARVAPSAMKDVEFELFDAAAAIRSKWTNVRLDAIAVLARTQPPEVEDLLQEALRSASNDDEKIAALWGLASIGSLHDPAPAAALVSSASSEVRLQAFETLHDCKAPQVMDLALSILDSTENARVEPTTPGPRFRSFDAVEGALLDAALDALVELADRKSRKKIRRLATKAGGFAAWESWKPREDRGLVMAWIDRGQRDWIGATAVVALAASGESDATAAIERAIVAGSESTTDAAIVESSRPSRVIGGFPSEFWTSRSLVESRIANARWPELHAADRMLEVRPSFRDEVFRRIAHSGRVSDMATVLLLSQTSHLEREDVALAKRLWNSARTAAPIEVEVFEHFNDAPIPYRHPYRAAGIAYLLGKQKDSNSLRELWNSARGDTLLVPEIVFAMTMTRDSSLVAPVLEYVRTVWETTIRGEAWRNLVRRNLGDIGLRWFIALRRSNPDFDFRTGPIVQHVTDVIPTDAGYALLVGDPTLSPLHRLFWISQASLLRGLHEGLDEPLARATRRIRDEVRGNDPMAFEIATSILEFQERMADSRRAQDAERAARAAGIPVASRKSP